MLKNPRGGLLQKDDRKPEVHALHLFDFDTRMPLAGSPIQFTNHIYCAAFSPDGAYLALGHDDGYVRLS